MSIDWVSLDKEVKEDFLLQKIKDGLLENQKEHVGFSVQDNKLLYKGRYVIPRASSFVSTLLHIVLLLVGAVGRFKNLS